MADSLADDSVVLVTGLPRSGTSLAMQMLAAGGLAVVADDARPPDDDNPRGYFESARALRLDRDATWLARCAGRAVKVLAHQLRHVPAAVPVRAVFVHRSVDEVVASQDAMIARRAALGLVPHSSSSADRLALIRVLEGHRIEARELLRARGVPTLDVEHAGMIRAPIESARAMGGFVQRDLDVDAMARAVEPSLYRQRTNACGAAQKSHSE